jgi:broad specificity phosphatase PhoE
MSRELFECALLRHGHTNYTEIYPDLTAEGIETITKTAEKLVHLGIQGKIKIISSDTVRTKGTADIIKKTLRVPDEIIIEPALTAMYLHDFAKAKTLIELFADGGGIRNVDRLYRTSPLFDNESIFEPRQKVRTRFLSYLENFCATREKGHEEQAYFIFVTHYELLIHLFQSLYPEDYLSARTIGNGEPFFLKCFTTATEGMYRVDARFREKASSGVLFEGELYVTCSN